MRRFPLLAIVLAVFAGSCVLSKTRVSGLGERASPFPSGTVVTVYMRNDSKSAWIPASGPKPQVLVADKDRVYRDADSKNPEEDGFIFYPLANGRYLVEARFGANHYGYAVLQVEDGKGLLSPLVCKSVPADRLTRAGMKMVANEDCWLEADPAGFLKSVAESAPDPIFLYVPLKPK